jgi:hypothetical protein
MFEILPFMKLRQFFEVRLQEKDYLSQLACVMGEQFRLLLHLTTLHQSPAHMKISTPLLSAHGPTGRYF